MVSAVAAAPASAQPALTPLPDLPVSRLERLNREAQAPPLPVTRLAERADLDARTLSLTFPQPLPLRDVLLVLVRDTPYSIVADADVGGTFVGELRVLTMRQALEAVLFPAGLDYEVTGTLVRVFPRRTYTRLFEVNLLSVRRSWHRESAGPSGDRLAASTGSDVFSELEAGVRALLSPSGRYHVDRRAGMVQVTDFSDRLDQIAVYLETAQLRASRQIRLDIRVLQIWPADMASGLDLEAMAARGETGLRLAAGSPAGILVEDLDVFLRALGTQGRLTRVASPQLVSMNNEPAFVRVDTSVLSEPGRGGSRPGANSTGLTLVVTPHISADGIVQLSISPRYTEAAPDSSVPATSHLTLSEADILVRVREGETVVLSGLPGRPLGEGEYGGNPEGRPTARAELILLVTPTLVSPAISLEAGVR
jgi:MSHA biogenesis protein MshL